MGGIKGSLLVTTDGLETACIAEVDRDRKVRDFYDMKSEAERHHDQFYALEAVFSHPFSYGSFYPGFVNMSWSEFKACETLKGISETTFEMMQSFCQQPVINSLSDEGAFLLKEKPQSHTGYSNPSLQADFVNSLADWEEWHRNWYAGHQELIDWEEGRSNWLPRIDLVHSILRRELRQALGQAAADLIRNSDVVNAFYEKVMKHVGPGIEAYASKIGGEVCRCNYYVAERELSRMEQQASGYSLREIYSIINRDGQQQFISIDFKHGMFEFHDQSGIHLGEFRFDGSFNSQAEADHSLRCIQEWHKRTGK